MDLDIIQSTKEGEITQFLCDVRDYFRASLATSEYENTSNMFYLTASGTTEQLLNRCECLLNRLNNKNRNSLMNTTTIGNDSSSMFVTNSLENHQWQHIKDKSNTDIKQCHSNVIKASTTQQQDQQQVPTEDVSYLDMSAVHYNNCNKKKKSPQSKIMDMNSSDDSDKTFRCSTFIVKQNKSFIHRAQDRLTATTDDEAEENESHDDKEGHLDDDPRIYDICQVTTQGSDGEEDEVGQEEIQKAITSDLHFSLPNVNCPYMDLPAGHLSIEKSTKYGQLQRIEKRLFFDQSKKYYCGILNDWLLCYADGPTSSRPTITLFFKMPGIEIEHFGEGKRRDVCFQITTCDPNRKFVFQAVNEIDAKEWIHAVETAIRSDTFGAGMRNSSTRKLPTPPVMKKITFLNSSQLSNGISMSTSATSNDCIYEEPSPIYHIQDSINSSLEKAPELPHKQTSATSLAEKLEYDIPKCPPQPLKFYPSNDGHSTNANANNKTEAAERLQANTMSVTNIASSSPSSIAKKINFKMDANLDFQSKVKNVHSKLTSQLSNGPNIKKTVKTSLASTSQNDAESFIGNSVLPSSTPSTAAELKKYKKSTTAQNQSSPQKTATEKQSFTKNWFLNRLNKTTSSSRSNTPSPSSSPSKLKQSEKENLLNLSDYESHDSHLSSNPTSPILKPSSPPSSTSKVNMIINQLEASGHLSSMFSVDAVASFNSFCDNDCNNYEPILTISSPPTSFMKKV